MALFIPIIVLGVVMVAYIPTYRRDEEDRALVARGVHVDATIIDLERLSTINNKPARPPMRVHVEIRREGEAPIRTSFERHIGLEDVDLFARGKIVKVAMDPQAPTRIALVE